MKKYAVLFMLLALLSLWAARPVWAQDGDGGDKVVMGGDFTLTAGETIEGNLIVMGGDVTIEAGATVEGDVVVMGGNIEIAGNVQGNITILGGSAHLADTAVIAGALSTLGGDIARDPGAEVRGGETQGFGPNRPNLTVPGVDARFSRVVNLAGGLLGAGISAVLAGLLALALATLMPQPLTRISAALTTAPVASGLLGFLTLLAVPIAMVLMAITLCLIPVSLILGVVYSAGLLLGWLALGAVFGAQVARTFNAPTSNPVLWTTGGVFALSLLANLLGLTADYSDFLVWPISWVMLCVNALLPAALMSFGLGAVLLTRFGMRPYYPTPTPPSAEAAPMV